MTKFGPPELVYDFRDFGRQHVLRDVLQDGESQLCCSPDGRHLFVQLLQRNKLLSFPRLPAHTPLSPSVYLEKSWSPHSPPLTGLLFPQCTEYGWLLILVWENGRAEVWSPPNTTLSKGWELLQALDLCNSPRARLASVCSNGSRLVWCEERPPSEAKQHEVSGAKPYRYCICQRTLVWEGAQQQVTLSSMKILLHHSPLYHMLSSPQHIYMVPDGGHWSSLTKVLLVYSPVEDKINMATTGKGLIHSKSLSVCESDFKKLVLECLGYMSFEAQSDIRSFAITCSGEMLLMDVKGGVHLLYPDGNVRHICDFDNETLTQEGKVSIQMFGRTLVCSLDRILYLIDADIGRMLEKKILSTDKVFLLNPLEADDIHLMTKAGIFKICCSDISIEETGKIEPALLEMIYEEACKYYQRRSLNSTKLSVRELKKDGMFQAPIMLSSILTSYQNKDKPKNKKFADLLHTMTSELQSYLSLEQLKTQIMNISENAIEKCCENLVDQEIVRLLHSDLDRRNLAYVNSLFSMFPKAAWKSIKECLQFHQNGDGKFVVRATADLWKKVLCPLPSGSRESSHNGISPLFEIVCQSLYKFKPKWLPLFVQQAQDCCGLSWNFSNKENCEGVPLYKRALAVVSKNKENTNFSHDCYLEIDILLYSGRPLAIVQAIHMLISLQQWERVIAETQKYSQLSPVISKDIFISLLTEFVKHRHLDSYVNQLCEICPDDLTATDILRTVLHNLPNEEHPPFSHPIGVHFTVGLLKPLLNKVLQNQFSQDLKCVGSPLSIPHRTNNFNVEHPLVNGDSLAEETSSMSDIYAPDSI